MPGRRSTFVLLFTGSLVVMLALTWLAPAASAQDLARMGLGWSFTNLDLDVTVLPDQEKITVRGTARLRLDIESSFGPTLVINGKTGGPS